MRETTLRGALRARFTGVKAVTYGSSDTDTDTGTGTGVNTDIDTNTDTNTDTYLDSCQLCELPREGHGRRYVQVRGYHEFQVPERCVRSSRASWRGALAAYSRALRRGKTECDALDAFDTVMYGSATGER